MACSVLFERRLWCRYLCPIGEAHAVQPRYAAVMH